MKYKKIVRDTGLVEAVCEHGVGHPIEESVLLFDMSGWEGMGLHGCDGCCKRDDFPKTIKEVMD